MIPADLFASGLLASAGAAAIPAAGALFPVAVGLGSSVTHCAGMCGPIHFFLASKGGAGHAIWSYHAGRILGYSLLGLLAGAAGDILSGGLTGGPVGEGIKAGAAWLLAILYALFGLQMLGWLPRRFQLETYAGRLFPSRLFGRLAADGRLGAGRMSAILFPVGLLASLLPCPSTHAVLLFSMGLADPGLGALAMGALGISTLPIFALIPRRLPARGPLARHYGAALGLIFLGLSAYRIYGAAITGFTAAPACH